MIRSSPETLLFQSSYNPLRAPMPMTFAVAAPSFRSLMLAMSHAFKVVDSVAGLNLNHRKYYCVQNGNSCQDLLEWVSTSREEFREMKIVKHAKYVGGHHDWT